MALRGAFRILILYDVAEALNLDMLRRCLGEQAEPARTRFPRRTPEYIRLEHPPIAGPPENLPLAGHDGVVATLRYYDFGVVVADLESPFHCEWEELMARSAQWLDGPATEGAARELVRRRLQSLAPAIHEPTRDWLHEAYLVVQVQEISGEPCQPGGEELLAARGGEIAQLVRGEVTALAPRAVEEIKQSAMSYYRGDVVVLGSSVAFVYDRPEDAAAIYQVVEYAKVQLLEFRYYDTLMSRLLQEVHETLDKPRNVVLSRWRLPRRAQHLNSIRLDVMNLTERVDSAIKFVSDAYYARVYRTAAQRMGVNEYRELVDEKLRAAGQLYTSMMDEFNDARSFLLELVVAFLCVLDIVFWLEFR